MELLIGDFPDTLRDNMALFLEQGCEHVGYTAYNPYQSAIAGAGETREIGLQNAGPPWDPAILWIVLYTAPKKTPRAGAGPHPRSTSMPHKALAVTTRSSRRRLSRFRVAAAWKPNKVLCRRKRRICSRSGQVGSLSISRQPCVLSSLLQLLQRMSSLLTTIPTWLHRRTTMVLQWVLIFKTAKAVY